VRVADAIRQDRGRLDIVFANAGIGTRIALNISITQDMGSPAFSMYAASKAAVRSLARTWTTDLKQRRIRVNAVSPGAVPTDAYTGELSMNQEQVDEYARSASQEIPVGRVGTPRDIGEAVVFLASDASSFITGIELTVDGGMTPVYAGRS
jgi:NAD(P)-dependent dehydrogenase (short-subunit alcohol dehydrogenase family)